MLLEQTLDKLNTMKLYGLVKSLKERLERQDHQSLSKAEFIGGWRQLDLPVNCRRAAGSR